MSYYSPWLDEELNWPFCGEEPGGYNTLHCPFAAGCKARTRPEGAHGPDDCASVEWCGMRRVMLDDPSAVNRDKFGPPAEPPPPPARMDWRPDAKLLAQARQDVERHRAAAHGQRRSRYAIQSTRSLEEWQQKRPSYASVTEAVRELCAYAPPQWAKAIRHMADLPERLVDAKNWTGAWNAMERLAAFDEQHGEAMAWNLSDEEICAKAEDLSHRMAHGIARIFRLHGVTESEAQKVRQRLAAWEEFDRQTKGKTPAQVRRETGRDLALWAARDGMSEAERAQAAEVLERERAAIEEALEYVSERCHAHSCKAPPLKRVPTVDQMLGALNRTKDAKWWRRALRKAAARIVEAGAIKLGEVNKRNGGYASNHAVRRRRSQLKRNAAAMAATLYRNEAGQIYSLAELMAASVSNPVNRGGELMTRIRGCEEYADAKGHIGLFITLTTPSAMHPMLSREWRRKGIAADMAERAGDSYAPTDAYRAIPNPRYDGHTTPRDAQDWLCRQWGRARAAMKKRGLAPYGFRVAEPHHDGTPHWHLLLWVETEDEADALQALIYKYWVNNDKRYQNERGAAKNRTNFKRMHAGGAAGYIAKYIAKSIGHHALREHMDEGEAGDLFTVELGGEQGHVRVDAWASTWSIRQFQPIGQPGVSVWREIRRVTEDQITTLSWTSDAQARLAWDAAQKIGEKKADWCAFMRAMGGAGLRRDEYRLKLACRSGTRINKYGETIPNGRVVGVRTCSGKWLISRRLGWVPLTHDESAEARLAKKRVACGEAPQDEQERAAKAAPWTGFNNCTARLTQGRANWLYAEAEAAAKADAEAQKWGLLARFLTARYRQQLQNVGATTDQIDQVAPLHGPMGRYTAQQLMRVMRMSVTETLEAMEKHGWTRGGVATELALA